eukprot:Skav224222  [mRNA]  locus=scaffold939:1117631:1120810:+ [translate_table: standard]
MLTGQTFPQTVNLPADMPSGPVTIRWLWVCKYTDEIFVSCMDTEIVGGSSTTGAATTTTTTVSTNSECIWTDPPVEVQRTPREEKEGRVCWDYVVPAGTKVFYQSKTDIYNKWNSEACCLSAADTYGSDSFGNPNIVVFTATIGNFGFCECTSWDPSNPGTSCAGEATAENMLCPVLGAQKDMCAESIDWDGLPVGCGTVSSTTSQSTTTTTGTSSTEGCCYWDESAGCPGNDYCDQSKSNCEGSCTGTWKSIGVNSLEECKQLCIANSACKGIEHIGTRCEIWTRHSNTEFMFTAPRPVRWKWLDWRLMLRGGPHLCLGQRLLFSMPVTRHGFLSWSIVEEEAIEALEALEVQEVHVLICLAHWILRNARCFEATPGIAFGGGLSAIEVMGSDGK